METRLKFEIGKTLTVFAIPYFSKELIDEKLNRTNEIKKNTTQLLTVDADTSYTSTMMLCTGANAIIK